MHRLLRKRDCVLVRRRSILRTLSMMKNMRMTRERSHWAQRTPANPRSHHHHLNQAMMKVVMMMAIVMKMMRTKILMKRKLSHRHYYHQVIKTMMKVTVSVTIVMRMMILIMLPIVDLFFILYIVLFSFAASSRSSLPTVYSVNYQRSGIPPRLHSATVSSSHTDT